MRKCRMTILLTLTFIAFALLLLPMHNVLAQVVYENANGYEVAIDDEADLLTEGEETELLQAMQSITEYGNVAFVSVNEDVSVITSKFADNYYANLWGNESGTVFVIDMGNRVLYIHSVGNVYNTLKTSYANTITDNVYTYATKGEYATCAQKVYEQIFQVLAGGRIAQPMKYISNALFSFLLSFVVLYIIVKLVSRAKKPSKAQLFNGLEVSQRMDNAAVHYLSEKRTYIAVRDGEFWYDILIGIIKIAFSILLGGGGGSQSSGSNRSSGSGGRKGGGGHRF